MSEYNLSIMELKEGKEYKYIAYDNILYTVDNGVIYSAYLDGSNKSKSSLATNKYNKKCFKEIKPEPKTKEVWQWRVQCDHSDFPFVDVDLLTEGEAQDKFSVCIYLYKHYGPFTVPDFSEDE